MRREAKLPRSGVAGGVASLRTDLHCFPSPLSLNTLRQQSTAVIARGGGSFARAALLVLCCCWPWLQPAGANEALDAVFPKSSIVIESSGGACYRFDVYLALAPQQWQRGLMHVRDLGAMTGMLFVYPESSPRSMWMKNTFIPLDMLFIREDGSIATIVTDTEPQSLASIASGEPVRYVLELNAGTTGRLGIVPGDAMLWEGGASATPSED